ncbi:SDR family NAD(P)-dependent oxidoreductase [Ekhidna sp.]|uniref:SDR family NAD(P)-dependent oxidoreductase n=1 Tax=Ekhidna sp. TaxID=2608089 RepID=UPI003C7D4E9D
MNNKIALITGASSGIGKELAHIHSEQGGDVVIVARSEEKLKELKEELEKKHGITAHVVVKDLSKPGAARELYDEVKKQGIEVGYLINNAGFGGVGKFHERNIHDDLNMINLNVSALTELTHYFLQDFVRSNEGKILNVSSTASLLPGPLQAVYYATKAFVTSFSNALVEELKDTNITVTNLMPGATETDFGKVSGMDKTDLFTDLTSARTVAEDGYNAMIKGKMDKISGLKLSQKIMMSFLPITPKKIVMRQVRQMQEIKD